MGTSRLQKLKRIARVNWAHLNSKPNFHHPNLHEFNNKLLRYTILQTIPDPIHNSYASRGDIFASARVQRQQHYNCNCPGPFLDLEGGLFTSSEGDRLSSSGLCKSFGIEEDVELLCDCACTFACRRCCRCICSNCCSLAVKLIPWWENLLSSFRFTSPSSVTCDPLDMCCRIR